LLLITTKDALTLDDFWRQTNYTGMHLTCQEKFNSASLKSNQDRGDVHGLLLMLAARTTSVTE